MVRYATVESFLLACGLEPSEVRSVLLTPSSLEVTMYKRDEFGEKYVEILTGEPAVERHVIGIDRG